MKSNIKNLQILSILSILIISILIACNEQKQDSEEIESKPESKEQQKAIDRNGNKIAF